MSTKWQVRPSELLGLDHVVEAYFFDKAVYYFGVTMEADVEEYSSSKGKKADKPEMTKMKRERRVNEWLNDGSTPQAKRFRDPNMNA